MASGKERHENKAGEYARRMLKSEIALADAQLWRDYELMLEGQAVYLQNFFCATGDYGLLKALTEELNANAGKGMVNWSRHFKHENPDFSPTFQLVVEGMARHFDVEVYATRLNFYPDGTSWKPFHHDSHAYGGRGLREDFTMGASFGDTRGLIFKHEASEQQFDFPQRNGDIFALTSTINQRFLHGVPKLKQSARSGAGPRFSIIAWGRRRELTPQNSGTGEVRLKETPLRRSGDDVRQDAPAEQVVGDETEEEVEDSGPDVDIRDVTDLVDRFIFGKAAQEERRRDLRASADGSNSGPSKVQGGWAGRKENAKKTRGRGGGRAGGRGRGGGGGGRGRKGDGDSSRGSRGKGKGGQSRGGKKKSKRGEKGNGMWKDNAADPNVSTSSSANAGVSFGW